MNTEKFYAPPQIEVVQLESESVFAASDVKFTNENYNTNNPGRYDW